MGLTAYSTDELKEELEKRKSIRPKIDRRFSELYDGLMGLYDDFNDIIVETEHYLNNVYTDGFVNVDAQTRVFHAIMKMLYGKNVMKNIILRLGG